MNSQHNTKLDYSLVQSKEAYEYLFLIEILWIIYGFCRSIVFCKGLALFY